MRLPLGEVATDDNDTSTPHSVSISTLLAKLKDSSNDEAYSQVLEEFIIEISRHLDYHNIPCALYGYCLLEVYGIPSDGHSVSTADIWVLGYPCPNLFVRMSALQSQTISSSLPLA